jgi:hypothetical protein
LYAGGFDAPDCNYVKGWAWDKNAPNTAVTVELVEGNTVYATILADTYRADLQAAGLGTGNYGFRIPTPTALKDGNAHPAQYPGKGEYSFIDWFSPGVDLHVQLVCWRLTHLIVIM